MYKHTSRLLFTCVATFIPLLVFGEPVARILNVRGQVQIANKDAQRSAKVYGALFAGETIHFEPKSSIFLMWPSSKRLERYTAPRDGRVDATLAANRLDSGDKLTSIRFPTKLPDVAFADLPSVSPGAVTVARSPKEPPSPPLRPIPYSTILDTTPEFSWPDVPGTTTYDVMLYRGDRGTNVVWKGQSATSTVSLPEADQLNPGGRYRLKVDAVGENMTRTQAVDNLRFSVAKPAVMKSAGQLHDLADATKNDDEDGVAILALVAARYEDLELYKQATEIYERLIDISPKTAEFHAALYELYQRAGLVDDSAKARAAAEELGFEFDD
jgi:hypothetical protein